MHVITLFMCDHSLTTHYSLTHSITQLVDSTTPMPCGSHIASLGDLLWSQTPSASRIDLCGFFGTWTQLWCYPRGRCRSSSWSCICLVSHWPYLKLIQYRSPNCTAPPVMMLRSPHLPCRLLREDSVQGRTLHPRRSVLSWSNPECPGWSHCCCQAKDQQVMAVSMRMQGECKWIELLRSNNS